MIDIAKFKTFKHFTTLNKALLFLIKSNKTAMQSVPKILKCPSSQKMLKSYNIVLVFSKFSSTEYISTMSTLHGCR